MPKFMPAREQAKPIRIIHDLDIIDSENIGIKWKGKDYVIEDLKVGQWMRLTLAYQKVLDLEFKLAQDDKVEQSELVVAYFNLFSLFISDITAVDIMEMGQHRINLILSVISRRIAGDPTLASDIQKKNLQSPKMKSTWNFFHKLPSFASFMAGLIKKS